MAHWRRRDFIGLVGGAAAWPLAARAQQPTMPVIGILGSGSPEPFASPIASFRRGLQESGWVEERNIAIQYRWGEGRYDRLPALAADLLRREVSAIFANSSAAVVAAKAATTTIPIIFTMGGDAVERGFVASINRPGGNITGVNFFASTLGAKQIELLHELAPGAAGIALLMNPKNSGADIQIARAREAARVVGQRIDVITAGSAAEIDAAFAALGTKRAHALLVGGDAFLLDRRDQIVALAARHALPAVYPLREFTSAGGLMSYGTSMQDAYRQAGLYAGRILKGEKPGELPVIQAVKVELVINLKTAKALGLEVPGTLLARADEVIE